MKNDMVFHPIIIIGMHRSGTSMISRILEELGLFMGQLKEQNHEALFFKLTNNWLLKQCGGAWDYPEPIRALLKNDEVRELMVDYLRYSMQTPRTASYLGLKKYLKYHTLSNLTFPWGWKDPRNTYTLPLWLDIFPDARIVHICRNGIDVANSLKVRAENLLIRSKASYSKIKWLYWILPLVKGFTHSLRCLDLNEGFSLWIDYLREARTHVQSIGANAMEIKFEEFLENPHNTLIKLNDFCNLSATEKAIDRAAAQIDRKRSYAYRHDPHLRAFAHKKFSQLQELGY